MGGNILVYFPAPPGVFAIFLGVLVVYLAYSLIKVVVSLWTGS